jgi:hypothetical protein
MVSASRKPRQLSPILYSVSAPNIEQPERVVVIGMSDVMRVLFVIVCESNGARLRIITARKANIAQRRIYEKNTELATTDMRRYSWSQATRGRFAALATPLRTPSAVRILDADLEAAFPDSASMNRALRALVDAARSANVGGLRASGKANRAA